MHSLRQKESRVYVLFPKMEWQNVVPYSSMAHGSPVAEAIDPVSQFYNTQFLLLILLIHRSSYSCYTAHNSSCSSYSLYTAPHTPRTPLLILLLHSSSYTAPHNSFCSSYSCYTAPHTPHTPHTPRTPFLILLLHSSSYTAPHNSSCSSYSSGCWSPEHFGSRLAPAHGFTGQAGCLKRPLWTSTVCLWLSSR